MKVVATLKIVCWHRVDTHTATQVMLKRELKNVRRELRNWEIAQHENAGGTHEGTVTANEKLNHERS